MYSLYRAWFGGEESYPRLESLSPPDTVVRVGNEGEYHFVAHRAVLSAHSGYLKAMLAGTGTTSPPGDVSSTHDGNPQPIVTSVTVPSTIGGEAFAPLLNYMYTGRLEVSLDNIYTVLLATHLLHMPGALDQCRAALLRLRTPPVVPAPGSPSPPPHLQQQQQQQQQHQQPGSVLRPVPNRVLAPSFCWPQNNSSHLYPTRHFDLPQLPALQLQPAAIAVLPTPTTIHKTTISYGYRSKEPSVSPSSNSSQVQQQQQHSGRRSASESPELVVASSSASSITQRSDDQQPSRDESTDQQQQQQLQEQKQQPQHPNRRRRPNSSRSGRGSSQRERSSSSSAVSGGPAIQTPGVVFDVACCDGPVRFHRVLNENYSPAAIQASTIQQQQLEQQQQQQPQPQSPQSLHQQIQNRVLASQCNGISSGCREAEEAPGRNNNSNRENDENEHQRTHPHHHRPPSSPGSSGDNSLGIYTCAYCQHTFKSQYCYRKHARRHLLPTDGENVNATGIQRQLHQPQPQPQPQQQQPQPQSQQPQQQRPQLEAKKREVRLLDLNVQYYPCKICGSKFPSYYFVHKHRKLCHANIEESQGGHVVGGPEVKTPPALPQQVQQQQQQQQQQPSTSENIQQST